MATSSQFNLQSSFSWPLVLVCAAMLACFAAFTTYDSVGTDDHVNQYYMYFIHVAIMVFVGFGFLMTFLRRYAYGAVALNYMASALVVLEFLLVGGAIHQHWEGHPSVSDKIALNLPLMIDALFCAASCMITFGAVIGKVSASQLLWLLIMEVPIYAINQKIVFYYLKGLDIGGSLTIHVFGAYFGLAASMWLSKKGTGMEHPKNGASYLNDVTSMIGTIFLFIYWPSFNGALASNPTLDPVPVQTQFYCIVNTVLSLMGCVLATFVMSSLLEGKFNMMHVQNATVAGGVAVGSCCNLRIQPAGALAIGMLAGSLSTFGFGRIQPFLEKRIGLKDTCGVHNLHGMPGLLSGFAATIAAAAGYYANDVVLDVAYSGLKTPAYEIACMFATLGIAIVTGNIAGFIISRTTPAAQELPEAFEDDVMWCDVEPEYNQQQQVQVHEGLESSEPSVWVQIDTEQPVNNNNTDYIVKAELPIDDKTAGIAKVSSDLKKDKDKGTRRHDGAGRIMVNSIQRTSIQAHRANFTILPSGNSDV